MMCHCFILYFAGQINLEVAVGGYFIITPSSMHFKNMVIYKST